MEARVLLAGLGVLWGAAGSSAALAAPPGAPGIEIAPYFNIENPAPAGSPYLWPTTGLMDARAKAGLTNAMITLGDIGQPGDCPDISVVKDQPLQDIRDFIAAGGDVIFSISGATCGHREHRHDHDPARDRTLEQALTEVIQKTGIKHFDFDVEEHFVTSKADLDRRNQAILALKKAYPDLFVSFTIAATPLVDWNTDPTQAGLATGEFNLIRDTLAAGVTIDRVTIMPFAWGFSEETYQKYSFADLTIMTSEEVIDQMEVLFSPNPVSPLPRQMLYPMFGILPAIGRSMDDRNGAFYPQDARAVADYAQAKGVGYLSYYVFQRDLMQTSFGQTTEDYLNRHSGVPQTDYEFFHCFEGLGPCSGPATDHHVHLR